MKVKLLLAMISLSILASSTFASEVEAVPLPPNVSHQAWETLLKKYVNDCGLVAYGFWKKNQTDLSALDSYLKQFAEKPQTPASGNDAAASLINLYNATTIRWILTNYPVESIMGLKDSFEAKRHDIGGRKASLDDIEHGTLRPLLGYRAHAVLVCAARSCPPLQRFAYTPSQLDAQIDSAYRAWLAQRPERSQQRLRPETNDLGLNPQFHAVLEVDELSNQILKFISSFGFFESTYHALFGTCAR